MTNSIELSHYFAINDDLRSKPKHQKTGLLESADMTHSFIPRLIAIGAVAAFATAGQATALHPDQIGWSALKFRATKFFFRIDANIAITSMDAAVVAAQLVAAREGHVVQPVGNQRILSVDTKAFGRLSQIELILNAGSAAALQKTSHDSGGRYRHRIYRFTDRGAYQTTRRPIGRNEERLPADQWPQWSEANEDLRPYPSSVFGAEITGPIGLLYAVGAAPLYKSGDTFEILTFVRNHVHRVQIEVAGLEALKVKYRFDNGITTVKHKGKQSAIRMLMRGEVIDGGDAEFELLGLRGDIVLHLDPATRAPLQLEGHIKIAGHTKVRLIEMTATNRAGQMK